MTKDYRLYVNVDITHLVVYAHDRTLVRGIDLASEQPREVYVPKGDSLHAVNESGPLFLWRPPIDEDGIVQLVYAPRPAPAQHWDTERYTGAFDNKGIDDAQDVAEGLAGYTPPGIIVDEIQEFGGADDAPNDKCSECGRTNHGNMVRPDRYSPILEFFNYAHLPEKLQDLSRPFNEVAWEMEQRLPDGPEKSAGLRKLLEAKDCFVRAAL